MDDANNDYEELLQDATTFLEETGKSLDIVRLTNFIRVFLEKCNRRSRTNVGGKNTLSDTSVFWDLVPLNTRIRTALYELIQKTNKTICACRALNYGIRKRRDTKVPGAAPWDFEMQFEKSAVNALNNTQDVSFRIIVQLARWAINLCIPLRTIYENSLYLDQEIDAVRRKFADRFAKAEHEFLCERDKSNECLRVVGSQERTVIQRRCDDLTDNILRLQLLLQNAPMRAKLEVHDALNTMEANFAAQERNIEKQMQTAKNSVAEQINSLHVELVQLMQLQQSVNAIESVDNSIRQLISRSIRDLIDSTNTLRIENDTLEKEVSNVYNRVLYLITERPSVKLTPAQLSHIQQIEHPSIAMPIDKTLEVYSDFCIRQCREALKTPLEQSPRIFRETLANITRDRLVAFLFTYGDLACLADLRYILRKHTWANLSNIPHVLLQNKRAFAIFVTYDWSGLQYVPFSTLTTILDLFELRRWHFNERVRKGGISTLIHRLR